MQYSIHYSQIFFLKYELHLHGAAWCCCTSSCIFARRAAKAARYAGALYWAHGRNFFGEATVRERHVILVLNDLSQFNHENMSNNLNCETMQSLNNNVSYTYYMHISAYHIISYIVYTCTYIYISPYLIRSFFLVTWPAENLPAWWPVSRFLVEMETNVARVIYHWNLLCSQCLLWTIWTIQPVPLSRQSLEAPWAQEMGKRQGHQLAGTQYVTI